MRETNVLLCFHWMLVLYVILCNVPARAAQGGSNVSTKKSLVWGPGLKTDFLVPVRYFYIQLVDKDGLNLTDSAGQQAVTVSIESKDRARIWTQVLDRHDGSYIVRFRPFSTTNSIDITVKWEGKHLAKSPYRLEGIIQHETCNCPRQKLSEWTESLGCPVSYSQIELDLEPFGSVDMAKAAKEAVQRFSDAGQHSICHYKIIKNKIYRKCYGQHVGFKMFSDAILLSLTRKMLFPDFEFIVNLGDWPLEQRSARDNPLPIFSWCGSHQSRDIILPTYDITEATLEMMGRVTLDIFSTQANTGPKWANKTDKAFWRGRDSRKERLKLVEMSREHPDLIDARLTNMFFFPKNESKYGELAKPVSFFDFFKYKYQLNIDGTVAAYRFPYLLAGDSLILKQDSGFYEHFYRDLVPNYHYIPIKSDLSDLLEKIQWARDNDEEAKQIAQHSQQYARENLDPAQILCYHVRVFEDFAKRLTKKPKGIKGFELVPHPEDKSPCSCPKVDSEKQRDEL